MNDSIYIQKDSRRQIHIYAVVTGKVTELYKGFDTDEAIKTIETYRYNRVIEFTQAITRINEQAEKALNTLWPIK